MNRPRALGVLTITLALAGAACADLTRGISIARDATFDLLPPASFGRSLALEQVVEARYRDPTREQTVVLHCALEIEPQGLHLVGLTPFGTCAFVVTLDAAGLAIENRVGENLPADPRQVLADLQLALWPTLPTIAGLIVSEEPAADGGRVRELRRATASEPLLAAVPVVRIRYGPGLPWESKLVFEHLERGYTLTVETVSCVPLEP